MQWQGEPAGSFKSEETCHVLPCFAVVHFFAVLQFVLQLCHVFCSSAMCFAVVLKSCTIPTYNFADVLMK